MAKKTNAALISNAQSLLAHGGSPARMLAQNLMKSKDGKLNFNALRTNDVLRKDEWKLLDEVLVDVGRDLLVAANDLRAAGLVEQLGGIGITLSEYEKISDMSAANVDFAAVTDGEKDSVTFTLVAVPVPIIHKDFSVNIRRLEASRGSQSHGQAIDRTQVEVAAIKVAESAEDMVFNGTPDTLVGNALYGYTNAPNRNTVTGGDWGTLANTTANVITALSASNADGYRGPYNLYVATTQYGQLREFYTDGSGHTGFDRVGTLVGGVNRIKSGDRLDDAEAVMVTMRRNVVDLAIGMDMTVVEWDSKGGLMFDFKVMTAVTIRVKDDQNSGSGVVHITGI